MLHILAEVAPLKIADGSRPVLRASSAQDRRLNGVAGQRWWPGITKLPSLAIPLFDGDFTEEVAPGSASFTLRLEALANLDASVRAYRWAGAAVSLYAIDGGLSLNAAGSYDVASLDAARIFKGRVESFAIDGGALSLTAEVDQEPFNKDVLQLTYAGTGEAEGGEDLKERLKPWIFGRALNVEPILINSVDNVVQFSAYPIQGISALYERGSSFGPSIGNYSSYAQLVAATIPAGSWATCHALGMARLGAPPYGVITGDVDGDNVSGFIRRTGAIIRRVALASGVALGQIDTASLDALDAAVPYDINLVLTEQISVLDLARRLALPCNAQAGLDFQGRLFAVRPSIGSPSLTLDAQGRQLPPVRRCQEADVSAPYKRITFGANRSWRVHTFDEIAFDAELVDRGDYDPDKTYRRGNIVSLPNGSRWLYVSDTPKKGSLPSSTNADWEQMTGAITAGNITYEDGTPVEDLKPAEPGATDGASPAEKDQLAQLEADTAAAQVRMEQADAKIADLFETYGDSASAAQSALAAAQSAQTAQDAEANAEAARDLAQDARDAAEQASTNASNFANASSLSATASDQARGLAVTAKTAAETARNQAQTAKADAETAFTNSTTARDASVAAKQAAELARDNAQTYASNADGSATAAAGSASTASTKATDAGNSATAAAASQVSAASSYADAQALAYVSAPLLISTFREGAKHWTASRFGNPTTVASTPGAAVTDADLGAALEISTWGGAGANVLSKGIIPVVPGRIYEVTATFKITASDGSVGMNVILGTMIAGYAQASVSYVGSPSTDCTGTGTFTLTRKFAVGGGTNITSIPVDVLTARPGLRMTTTETGVVLRVSEIRVNDVTEREAASTHANAAATSASSASTSASDAGESATAAQESATNAETSAGNASTSEQNASTSETNAAGSASAALISEGAAATSATNAGNSADAASTSASTASTKATEAGQKASAAATSATNASTSAGNASTYASNASTSATNAAGSANSASTSANNAAQSKTDAANSATAAAGSASTASTKASEAGQSATSASTSAVSANSTYSAMIQSQAASPVLPHDFSDGLNQWTGDRGGRPDQVTQVAGSVINGDSFFGRCADFPWAIAGMNVLTRGTVRATAGRYYEVRARIRVRQGDGSYSFNIIGVGLDGNGAEIANVLSGTATVTGTVSEIVGLFSSAALNDATAWPSGSVFLRFGLRLNSAETGMIVRVGSIRVIDVTERVAAALSASAAATSASTASTKAGAAGQSATAAQESATNAETAEGNASTYANQASESADDASGSASSASLSATAAAKSKDDAAGSATAAAGSASTASTKATAAEQSATAANTSAVAANATFTNLKNTVANQSQALPFDFKDGNTYWTNDRTGAPDTRPAASGSPVANDPIFGTASWAIDDWNTAGHNILTRGVVPIIPGRFYEVRARFRVASGVPVDFNLAGAGMAADYSGTASAYRPGPSITVTGGGIYELVGLFSDTTANGATAFTSEAVWARFGLRLNSSKATTVRVQSIRVTDVTDKLAAANSASAASGSASSASGSATAAGASAQSASGSANTASSKAGEAADSANAAQTSAGAASTSATAASQSASAASSNKVAAEIAAQNSLFLDAGYVADFTGSNLNGFTTSGATMSATAAGAIVVPTTGDPQIYRTSLSIQGSRFTRVLIDLTRTAPTLGGWDGKLYWATSGHGWNGSFVATAVQGEPKVGENITLVFDMPNATGGADWLASTITGLRFDLDGTSGGGRQSVIRSIRVMGPDSAAPAKLASAAATSASSAGGYADAAEQHAGAAEESATSAETSASNASTSEQNASASKTNAEGSASAASLSAEAAAQSKSDAAGSATAAAGSASTASTKASEAGQSATAANASAVSANSTYNAMIQSQAASPVLPSDFSDGLNQWTNDRSGRPDQVGAANGTVINGDGTFGRCADFAWTTAGQGVLTRGWVPTTAGRFYEVRARFRVRQGDGSYNFTIIGGWMDATGVDAGNSFVQNTTVDGSVREIVAVFSDTASSGVFAWPANSVFARFGLRLNSSETGMIVRVGSIKVTDITEKRAAANSASAASASATNAASSATNAGASATAASGHADTAQTKSEDAAASASAASSSAAAADDSASSASSSATQASTYKGDAESAASTATSQATVATNAAAAASSSATITAQVAAASINPNPVFSDWPNGQALPGNYSLWGGTPTVYKMTGAQSPYAPMTVMASNTNASGGGLQSNPYTASQVIQNGMWLVLEVDARRGSVSSDMRGACVLFRAIDSSGGTAQNHYLDLYADADTAGTSGNGNMGVRRWRKLVKVQAASAYGWRIYIMNRFSGAPSYVSTATENQIEWHRVSFRPATDQEIASQKATGDISALAGTVSSQAQALSDLSGSYASLETTVSAQDLTITNQSQAISSIEDGVETLFGRNAMTIAAGGVITGWENSTNGTVSSFKIRADVFELVPSSGSGERTSYSGGAWRGWDANNVKRWQLGKQD
ncbi:hypothetical protein [uncultured Sphingobium sp.]|uniref:hypothetical protein n=1 Tax=uncultured Sphingobium sp. TaxID=316087 RepID=UPI0032B18569|tara:strand:+ start:37082 stop:44578 length:7497 start_codon:yes stop_codon:yes gene_type:complete